MARRLTRYLALSVLPAGHGARSGTRVLFALMLVLQALGMQQARSQERLAKESYESAEAAFVGVFITSGLGLRAFFENREYAAALYQLPDGSWHATPSVPGSRLASAIPYHAVPLDAVFIAGAHTHGQPHIPEDPDHDYGREFSNIDRTTALRNFQISRGKICKQLLLTSDMRILRLRFDERALPSAENLPTVGGVHDRIDVLGRLGLDGRVDEAAAREIP